MCDGKDRSHLHLVDGQVRRHGTLETVVLGPEVLSGDFVLFWAHRFHCHSSCRLLTLAAAQPQEKGSLTPVQPISHEMVGQLGW